MTPATRNRPFDMDRKVARFARAREKYNNSRLGEGDKAYAEMEFLVAEAEAAGCLIEFVRKVNP